MTQLPATYHEVIEAEASAFAEQRIAHLGEGDFIVPMGESNFIDLGCAPLDPDAGRRLTRRLIQQYALHDSPSMLQITELAEIWDEADHVVRDLILEYTNRHEPLPAFLATYNAKILAGHTTKKPRGRKKASNFLQDFCFVIIIIELCQKFNLRPKRFQLGKKRTPSACSIVAAAATKAGLHRGGEDAIQKIWDRFEPIVVRAGLAEIIRN